MILQFEFIKQDSAWYFHDRPYARSRGTKGALTPLLKEGLHTLLDEVGRHATRVVMRSSDEPLAGSDELELTTPDKDGTGGYYLLKTLHQQPYVLLIRFYDVCAFFGYRPDRLYIQLEVQD